MHFDLALDELRGFCPDVAEPTDFDGFWSHRLDVAGDMPLDVDAERVDGAVRTVDVHDVHFTGHGGVRIAAWMFMPRDIDPAAPVVVEFLGYNGGRGRPIDWMTWSAAGIPHLVVDSRGQGGGWRGADTPDPGDDGEPGGMTFLTRGLSAPDRHYYARLYVDAARALRVPGEIEALAGRPVVATGRSQGGALALAAANLSGVPALVAPDVPFLSHFRRAVSLTDALPYCEIAAYCRAYPDRVERTFETLSYFDVVNHARRLDAPAIFSVGLVDLITPPSTVFAAFNHYGTGASRSSRKPVDEYVIDKRIDVYEFNGHEGGGSLHLERQITFVRDRLGG